MNAGVSSRGSPTPKSITSRPAATAAALRAVELLERIRLDRRGSRATGGSSRLLRGSVPPGTLAARRSARTSAATRRARRRGERTAGRRGRSSPRRPPPSELGDRGPGLLRTDLELPASRSRPPAGCDRHRARAARCRGSRARRAIGPAGPAAAPRPPAGVRPGAYRKFTWPHAVGDRRSRDPALDRRHAHDLAEHEAVDLDVAHGQVGDRARAPGSPAWTAFVPEPRTRAVRRAPAHGHRAFRLPRQPISSALAVGSITIARSTSRLAGHRSSSGSERALGRSGAPRGRRTGTRRRGRTASDRRRRPRARASPRARPSCRRRHGPPRRRPRAGRGRCPRRGRCRRGPPAATSGGLRRDAAGRNSRAASPSSASDERSGGTQIADPRRASPPRRGSRTASRRARASRAASRRRQVVGHARASGVQVDRPRRRRAPPDRSGTPRRRRGARPRASPPREPDRHARRRQPGLVRRHRDRAGAACRTPSSRPPPLPDPDVDPSPLDARELDVRAARGTHSWRSSAGPMCSDVVPRGSSSTNRTRCGLPIETAVAGKRQPPPTSNGSPRNVSQAGPRIGIAAFVKFGAPIPTVTERTAPSSRAASVDVLHARRASRRRTTAPSTSPRSCASTPEAADPVAAHLGDAAVGVR